MTDLAPFTKLLLWIALIVAVLGWAIAAVVLMVLALVNEVLLFWALRGDDAST